jgi:hypothetical protein
MTLRDTLRDRALRRYAHTNDPDAAELARNIAAGAVVTVRWETLKGALWETRPVLEGINADELNRLHNLGVKKWVVLEDGTYEPLT